MSPEGTYNLTFSKGIKILAYFLVFSSSANQNSKCLVQLESSTLHVRNLYNGKILRNEDTMLLFFEIGMLVISLVFYQSNLKHRNWDHKLFPFNLVCLKSESFVSPNGKLPFVSTPWLLA